MDLALYAHVLWRHRRLLLVGAGVAVLLAVLSYYRVDMGVPPKLTPRKAEVWQSTASVLLTQRSQVVPVPGVSDPGSLANVVGLYARLATSDDVLRRMKGVPRTAGAFQAASSLDRNSESVLPVVTLFGTGTTPEGATAIVGSGMTAFLSYVRSQQAAVPGRSRVDLRVLNSPQPAELIEPRKKTLPIVVFLSVLIAAMASAFILENRNRVSSSAGVAIAVPREEVELRTALPPQEAVPVEDTAEAEVRAASVRRWA